MKNLIIFAITIIVLTLFIKKHRLKEEKKENFLFLRNVRKTTIGTECAATENLGQNSCNELGMGYTFSGTNEDDCPSGQGRAQCVKTGEPNDVVHTSQRKVSGQGHQPLNTDSLNNLNASCSNNSALSSINLNTDWGNHRIYGGVKINDAGSGWQCRTKQIGDHDDEHICLGMDNRAKGCRSDPKNGTACWFKMEGTNECSGWTCQSPEASGKYKRCVTNNRESYPCPGYAWKTVGYRKWAFFKIPIRRQVYEANRRCNRRIRKGYVCLNRDNTRVGCSKTNTHGCWHQTNPNLDENNLVPSPTFSKYKFKCMNNPNQKGCSIRRTPWTSSFYTTKTENNYKDYRSLVDQNISCKEDEALKELKLQKNGFNVRYEYKCCSAPSVQCSEHKTNWAWSDKNAGSLENHRITCPNGKFLRKLRLEKHPQYEWYRYKYNCCTPMQVPNINTMPLTPTTLGSSVNKHYSLSQCASYKCRMEGDKCGGTETNPNKICVDHGRGKLRWRRPHQLIWYGKQNLLSKLNDSQLYKKLCKNWFNDPNPEKTWKRNDPQGKRMTDFCRNYQMYYHNKFPAEPIRDDIEYKPLWTMESENPDDVFGALR